MLKSRSCSCSGPGNVCASDPNGLGTPTCVNNVCGLSCGTAAVYNPTTKSCVANTPSACGSSLTVCKAPAGGFGTPVCNNGQCSVTCQDARTYNPTTNTCDSGSTATSCGPLGLPCPSDPSGKGTPTCSSLGVCSLTCPSGYVYNPTPLVAACVPAGNPNSCPIALFVSQSCPSPPNGQAICVPLLGALFSVCDYVCNTGYTKGSNLLTGFGGTFILGTASCTANSNTVNACGASQTKCTTTDPNATPTCIAGTCGTQCNTGYGYDPTQKKCISTTGDNNNCGSVGNVCLSPLNGSVQCSNSQCKITCNTGYLANALSCILQGSAKARTKKRSPAVLGLCPLGETACPISGSSSFRAFSMSSNQQLDFAKAAGGFECLDTQSSLESCGGCASTGEGKDCTTIAHSAGVGCSAGQCVVFSCEPGYVASLNSTKCLKVHTGSRRHGKGFSSSLIH